jgi:hypothetical protein
LLSTRLSILGRWERAVIVDVHTLEGTRLPRIPDAVIDGIIHHDSLRLLGLE